METIVDPDGSIRVDHQEDVGSWRRVDLGFLRIDETDVRGPEFVNHLEE